MECVICKSQIIEGTKLCPICRSHQSLFKRFVFGAAAITGFISLLGSAALFVLSKTSEIKKLFVWKDNVQIISYESGDNQVYLNSGDGDIFLSHIRIKASNGNEATTLINMIVERNKFLYYRPSMTVNNIESPVTPAEVAYQNVKPSPVNCIQWKYFSLNDPGLQQYTDFLKDKLVSVDAVATLYYYSTHHNEEKKLQFPAKGILIKILSQECSNKFANDKNPLKAISSGVR